MMSLVASTALALLLVQNAAGISVRRQLEMMHQSEGGKMTEAWTRERAPAPAKAVCDKIHKPSTAEYHLWNSTRKYFSQLGQDYRLASLFNGTKGFFIESGAADGETNSNTLYYEKQGWTGLLVEPNPKTFRMLLGKNRKAYSYNGALSTTGELGTMHLKVTDCGAAAGLYKGDGECSSMSNHATKNSIEVPLAPLEQLLGCMGRSTVDFWSLDVEGVESMIMKSFPFHEIEVGVMLIEMNKPGPNNGRIVEIMKTNGFQECGRGELDRIYVNPRYFTARGLNTPVKC